jgi:hypothetical protein
MQQSYRELDQSAGSAQLRMLPALNVEMCMAQHLSLPAHCGPRRTSQELQCGFLEAGLQVKVLTVR